MISYANAGKLINSDISEIHVYPNRIWIDFNNINNLFRLGRINYTKAHIPLQKHIHAGSMEICYMFRGKQTYCVAGEEFNLKGGNVFITFPNELHDSGTNPEDKSVLYFLIIDLSSTNDNFIGYQSDDSKELLNGLNNIKKRMFRGEPILKNILDTIIDTCMNNKPYKNILVRNLITEFIIRVMELEKTETYEISTEIGSTIKFIKDHVYENIDIAYLAKRVNFSVSWFKQKFKREIGIPPAEFIMRHKVDEAVKILMTSDSSITDIAHRLNFSSSQYFSSVFKKFTNTNPKSYKKEDEYYRSFEKKE